jgi:hypothetical protein
VAKGGSAARELRDERVRKHDTSAGSQNSNMTIGVVFVGEANLGGSDGS